MAAARPGASGRQPALGPLLFQRTTGEETPTIVQRLAQQIDVAHKGLTLVGKAGERVIFACSRRIRHTLAPDSSSLTFAAKEDLVNHWIVALTLRLDRDWTWDGPAPRRASRSSVTAARIPAGRRQVGEWEIVQTASLQALQDPERTYTRLVFLDAVEPQTAPAGGRASPRMCDFPSHRISNTRWSRGSGRPRCPPTCRCP